MTAVPHEASGVLPSRIATNTSSIQRWISSSPHLLQAALLAREFDATIQFTNPPRAIQRRTSRNPANQMTTSTDEPEPTDSAQSEWTLTRAEGQHAMMVAGWARSAEEAGYWCSRAEHPFPASAITAWWEGSDVQPWLLLDDNANPVAYGEIWVDAEEDETELARLIVDPARRRVGIGRRLVDELLAIATSSGRSACIIRVAPGNDGALALYRAAGFRDVDDATAADWNQGQPAEYRWLEHPAVPATGAR